jgi:hypothetical protein
MEIFLTYSVIITTLLGDKGTSISLKYSRK